MNQFNDEKKCFVCSKQFTGRSNKIFCGINCKNHYTLEVRRNTNADSEAAMEILHKNNEILKALFQPGFQIQKLPKLLLQQLGFEFGYYTSSKVAESGMVYSIFRFDFSLEEKMISLSYNPKAEDITDLLKRKYTYSFPLAFLN